jgi:hypothetical protein
MVKLGGAVTLGGVFPVGVLAAQEAVVDRAFKISAMLTLWK